MDDAEFRRSLEAASPPRGMQRALQALWWDARGDWDKAHRCAMQDDTQEGAWAHAYLHRKEGDLPNARYWYRQAGKTMPDGALAAEWRAMVKALLAE